MSGHSLRQTLGSSCVNQVTSSESCNQHGWYFENTHVRLPSSDMMGTIHTCTDIKYSFTEIVHYTYTITTVQYRCIEPVMAYLAYLYGAELVHRALDLYCTSLTVTPREQARALNTCLGSG